MTNFGLVSVGFGGSLNLQLICTLVRVKRLWLSVLAICGLLSACSTPTRQSPEQGALKEVAVQAIALVGAPYRYSGNTPESGFDCSGLIVYVVKRAVGLDLPRTVKEIARHGEEQRFTELQPGDLVFFDTRGELYSHAGIYVGQNRFVHAPATGGVVRLDSLKAAYWTQRFIGARRLSIKPSE